MFALFLREDSAGKWDLVVAAPWIERDKKWALGFLSVCLRQKLEIDDLIKISRIVVIDEANPGLREVHDAVTIEHGREELSNKPFFGLQIRQAYIITSRPNTSESDVLAVA